MFRPRVIPVLLLKNLGLVKSVKFRNCRYIGDPINAVKLFNDLGADELAFLDILASIEKRTISLDFVKRVGDEANMPFSVGGGIRSISEIQEILRAGAEKVILNTIASEKPSFVKEAAGEFGSSTIVISIDVNKSLFGKELVYSYSGRKATKYDPVTFARLMEDNGAGEIIINSIERDGMMNGYDIPLVRRISEVVRIPVVALGGAGSYDDLHKGVTNAYASAVAAGSLFVYHGARRAVLINYPTEDELLKLFHEDSD
jgi:cyclase